MDVRLINPFVRATQHVFEVMLARRVVAGTLVATPTLPPGPRCVNAIIRMAGGVNGVVILRFPGSVILPVATALAGPGLSVDHAYEGISEIANMITGNAKQDLARHLVRISAPVIAVGDNGLAGIAHMRPWLYLPFTGPLGEFYLAASISNLTEVPTPDFSSNPPTNDCVIDPGTIQ